MNYQSYKNARDASWSLLIDVSISSLPVDIKPILKYLNIKVHKDTNTQKASNERGYSVLKDNSYHIIVPDCPIPQKRYTIMHEVGHIVMKHIQDKPEYEYEAERFAIDILAPACVLWGLNIHDPKNIKKLCNISITSAKKRADRMEILYKRERDFLIKYGHSCFLQSQLERQVFRQFRSFIEEQKA